MSFLRLREGLSSLRHASLFWLSSIKIISFAPLRTRAAAPRPMPHQAPVSAVRKIRSRISADQVAPPRAVAAASRTKACW